MAGPNFGDVSGLKLSKPTGLTNFSAAGGGVAFPHVAGEGQNQGGGGIISGVENAVGSIPGVRWAGHELGVTARDLEQMAINTIPGTYHLIGGLIHDPLTTLENQWKYGILPTIEHPLAHPGYTLANALLFTGLAGGLAGRVGTAGAIAGREGALEPGLAAGIAAGLAKNPEIGPPISPALVAKGLGRAAEYNLHFKPTSTQVGHALLHGLAPRERLLPLSEGRYQHGWQYSRNAGVRASQMLLDELHQAHPTLHIPLIWKAQEARIGSALKATQVIERNVERGKGELFARKWEKATDPFHLAARMVLEGTLPKDLLELHKRAIETGTLTAKQLRETEARLKMIPEAEKLLTTKDFTIGHLTTPEDLALLRAIGGSDMLGKTIEPRQGLNKEAIKRMVQDGLLTFTKNDRGNWRARITPEGTQFVTNERQLAEPRVETLPRVKGEHKDLQEYVDQAREISNARSTSARFASILGEYSDFMRRVAPREYAKFGEVPENLKRLHRRLAYHEGRGNLEAVKRTEARIAAVEGKLTQEQRDLLGGAQPNFLTLEHAKQLTEQAGLARVPYEIPQTLTDSFGSLSFRKAKRFVTKGQPPSSFTHRFEGKILATGAGKTNTARLLAESYTESYRFIAFRKLREQILATGVKDARSIPAQYRVLMRDDSISGGGVPTIERAARIVWGNKSEPLNPDEYAAAGMQYEGMRNHYFPGVDKIAGILKGKYDNFVRGESVRAPHGYVWVDKRTLGGLEKPNPLFSVFSEPTIRTAFRTFDAINNAQKAAILYLKPAYAIPNMLGNVALNFVQQGLFAPWNIAKSALAYRWLDPETRGIIHAGMGEGFAESLSPQGFTGRITHTGNWLASKYGKLIDDPFRFASFLHEARLDGFTTRDELFNLTHKDEYQAQLKDIFNRANDEIIQYERLGPGEQAILRRLIFFYPWVKGSTRYTLNLAKNHPTATGLIGLQGQAGTKWLDEVLGNLPTWAEGIVPYSGVKNGIATVGNPAAASILQTPAQLLEAGVNLIHNNPNPGLSFIQNLSPADSGALAFFTLGRLTSIPHPVSENPVVSALNETFGGQPAYRLINQILHGTRPNAVYPDNDLMRALSRYFVLGNITARKANVTKLNYDAWKQQNPQGFTGGG